MVGWSLSVVGEVSPAPRQRATFGVHRVRGYHPLVATRADSGDVLHVGLRAGSVNTSRGTLRFGDELPARAASADRGVTAAG